MTVDELLDLEDQEQLDYLNNFISEGKSEAEVYESLSTTKQEMAKVGFFFVGGKFLLKPTRGYAKTKPTKLG
jgi:serine/threonine-protein kinase RIO1